MGMVGFSEEDLMYFLSLLSYKKLKKYQFLLREGKNYNQVAFINSGLLRMYFVVDGSEHIDGFTPEGEWLTDYASFLNRLPSTMYIEALADTELCLLSYDHIQKLYERGQDFERFGRIMTERFYLDAVLPR